MKKLTRNSKAAKLIIAVVAMTLMCSACSKKATDKDKQGRTVISVGNWPTAEGVDLDNINERKSAFEKGNTDVVIEPDLWAFDRKTFYAKAAGGQLPTVYEAGFTEMPEVMSSEYSADLTAALKKRGYEGKFNEAVLDVVSSNGKIYAFPKTGYVLGLAYNTEMMEAAGLMEEDGTPKQPKDWYELAEFAVKIKKATGKPGFIFPSANNAGGWIFSPVAWSFGVDFMEKGKDGKWKATFNSKECVEALQFIKDLKWKYDVLPANTLIDNPEHSKVFGTGGAGICIGAGDMPIKVVQYGMTPDQLGMMAMPKGTKRHVTLLGGGVYCINDKATDDQIDASLRWLETAYSYKATEEFKTNKETLIKADRDKGQLIGIKSLSVWNDNTDAVKYEHELIDKYANSNPNHVKLYNEFVANCPAEIQPEEPVCAQELYQILDGCIQEVLTNKNADCAELVEKACSDFQKNYLDNLTY